ncbi:MAG TPA: hypothetical protein PLM98_03670 [Thiolinea sp.]|mgnify:CR=1 FL=1|nr:hypothetical protein [Thiolinea sp.]
MYKLLLSCSCLALISVSSWVQADTSSAIDQTFFNVGGPRQAQVATVVAAPTTTPSISAAPAPQPITSQANTKEPDPLPDPALFTNVRSLSEQSSDNAYDIFGLGKRARAAEAAAAATPTGTVAADGTTVATAATTAAGPNMPDPSLFTNPGTPKEETRDHPFKLF